VENIPGGTGQAKGIVKLPIGEQTGVGSDLGTVKFQLQATVEINLQRSCPVITRRVTRDGSALMCVWY